MHVLSCLETVKHTNAEDMPSPPCSVVSWQHTVGHEACAWKAPKEVASTLWPFLSRLWRRLSPFTALTSLFQLRLSRL